MSTVVLKLYVAGRTANSARAIANLERLCRNEFPGAYELEIIDINENPELAEDANILATPAVIKELPPPIRRIVGDLSDREKVLLGLELYGSDEP